MAKETLTSMEQIQKFSKWVRIVFMFLIVYSFIRAIISVYAIWSGSPISRTFIYVEGFGLQEAKNFSNDGKIFLSIGAFLYFALLLKGFYHSCKLFYHYAEGKIFTTEANGQIRQLGITVCLWPVFIALWKYLSDIAANLTFGVPLGLKINIFGILNSTHLLIFGASIICISWIMEKGREIHEDQELTV
jgi:hypothetical protein